MYQRRRSQYVFTISDAYDQTGADDRLQLDAALTYDARPQLLAIARAMVEGMSDRG